MANDPRPLVPRRASKPPPSSSFSTLGVVALALGIGVLGAYALDFHGHTCEACGRRWHHLGAFNLGDVAAHTCKQCGEVQWWKNGFQEYAATGKLTDGAFQQPAPLAQPPSLLPSLEAFRGSRG